jgi:hypothetical protein
MKKFKDFMVEKILNKKTLSPEHIAKKHKVHIDHINKQLDMGIEVEKEHTSSVKAAREIALDHLSELPDYYSRLKKMEK